VEDQEKWHEGKSLPALQPDDAKRIVCHVRELGRPRLLAFVAPSSAEPIDVPFQAALGQSQNSAPIDSSSSGVALFNDI